MRIAGFCGWLVAVGCLAGAPAPEQLASPRDVASAERFTPLLLNIIEQISREYVRPVGRDELLLAALTGLYEDARLPVPAGLKKEIKQITQSLGARTAEVDEGVPTEPSVDEVKKLIRRVIAEVSRAQTKARGPLPADDPFREPSPNHSDASSIAARRFILLSTRAMARTLDQYTGVITASEYRRHMGEDEEGDRLGLHLRDDVSTGPIIVSDVQPGSPAQRAGLRPGDEIVQIDGKAVRELGEARLKLGLVATPTKVNPLTGEPERDRPARALSVSWRRLGLARVFSAELLPESFHTETIFGIARRENNSWNYWLDRRQKIAHVRVGALAKGTTSELKHVLTTLHDEGLRGLILDLRWSPGGYLLEATESAGLFLGETTVATVKARNQPDKTYRSAGDGKFMDFPMVVLVNGDTSGGAELIAAAVQDMKRAIIVGQRTRGKGSIQTSVYLGIDGVGLKLTSGTFIRPSGKNLHRFADSKAIDDWGVRPDDKHDYHVSADLNRTLADWWRMQTLRPGGSAERLPLDDPTADPSRQAALEALQTLIKSAAKN